MKQNMNRDPADSMRSAEIEQLMATCSVHNLETVSVIRA